MDQTIRFETGTTSRIGLRTVIAIACASALTCSWSSAQAAGCRAEDYQPGAAMRPCDRVYDFSVMPKFWRHLREAPSASEARVRLIRATGGFPIHFVGKNDMGMQTHVVVWNVEPTELAITLGKPDEGVVDLSILAPIVDGEQHKMIRFTADSASRAE